MQDEPESPDLPSLSPEPASQPTAGPVSNVPVLNVTPPGANNSTQAQSAVQAPAGAADNDLIEKEWVLKAKEIVAKTRNDPYSQQKEIEKFKADYMKKRYNKTIRVTDT